MVTIDSLLDSEIGVHTALHGSEITYGAHEEVLRWLDQTVQSDWRTLETGCGLSTIVFAASGTDHTSIAPFADERDRVTAWCESQGVDASGVTFVVDHSENVLPGLDGTLNLVLVDGSHAFPQVFLDWFYAGRALKVGGVLVNDDLQLWTGYTLHNFLKAEPGWELIEEWVGRTSAFRKTAEMDPMRSWSQQPYVRARSAEGGLQAYGVLLRRGQLRYAKERATAALRRRF